MNIDDFEKRLQEYLKENAGKILPVDVEQTEDDIAPHIKRVREHALANPCIFDEDFVRVFAEGRNRAIFSYGKSKSWLVSVLVSIAADEKFDRLFWQASTALISAFTAKARLVAMLPKDAQEQLTRSRDIVIRDVSQMAGCGGPVERFAQAKAFHACSFLTEAETLTAIDHMTREQIKKMDLYCVCGRSKREHTIPEPGYPSDAAIFGCDEFKLKKKF